MEVMIPSQSLTSSPHGSAPSSPRRIADYYFSAPTSPTHISHFYNDLDRFLLAGAGGGGGWSAAAVPFDWEEKPGTPKSPVADHTDDFAFAVSQDWETASLSAEELFDGGVIKPLKPPPRLTSAASPVRKQRSQARRIIQGAFSPRGKSKRETDDPFAAAAEAAPPLRGRERDVALSKPPSRRAARSLSPLRDFQYLWEEEEEERRQKGSNGGCSALTVAPSKGQKKWSFKDFFLFRSASEGRPLNKYTAAVSKRSSFRVMDSPGSGTGSKRRGPVSAHELHYTKNRAVSEDLKKKTFLPYKQGILGRLAFNPTVHALANGFGFSRK